MEVFRKLAVRENKKQEESADSGIPEVNCSVGIPEVNRSVGIPEVNCSVSNGHSP